MKKLKLSLLIVFLGIVSFVGAQTASLSVKAGLNLSNFYGNDLGDKKVRAGFTGGIGADFELMPNVAIQTGLFFSAKGAKFESTNQVGRFDGNVTANYLQLPVHAAYKIDVMPGTKVVFHAGPYVAYGVGGKSKVGSQKLDTFGGNEGLKRFDAGLGLGVGAEFGMLLVDLGWDMGIIDISKGGNGSIRNQNAYLTLGYRFW